MTYPTITPKLTLDFANSRQLDPRITFSRSSTATYLHPDTGLITTASSGVARFEKEGLLIEEARTNVVLNSGDISQAAPLASGTETITANAAVAPDGTTTATSVVPNSGATSTFLYGIASPTNPVSASVFLKANGWNYAGLWMNNYDGSSDARLAIDLTDGSVLTSQNSGLFKVTPCGNGWFRIALKSSTGNDGTLSIRLFNSSGSLTLPAMNGTDGIYCWGLQTETGEFPTSYIPTTSSTATRAADVASITGTSFSDWYNQGEGSLYAYFICNNGTDGAFYMWDGVGNNLNYWLVGVDSNAGGVIGFRTRSNQGTSGGTYQRGRINRDSNLGEAIKIAAAINTADFAAFTSSSSGDTNLNTGSPIQSGYLPPAVDRFVLTRDLAASTHIKRLSYYDRRISDAELETLTS